MLLSCGESQGEAPNISPSGVSFRGAEHLLLEIDGVDLSVLAHPSDEGTGEKPGPQPKSSTRAPG